ncbi:MAG: acetyl esterase/lipase [Planctomycetota bacterium]|jgi:acetyl esterase/lipase
MNRLLTVCVAAVLGTSMASGQDSQMVIENLWSAGSEGVNSTPGAGGNDEGDIPKLMITRVVSDQPTAAVVILPGGGYHGHAIGHEGHEFAEWFASQGVTSAICTYRVRGKGNAGRGYGHPYPMMDAQRAIRSLRARADELNIDPKRIGVIGFSAGGHLASTVSNHFAYIDAQAVDPLLRVSSRPDFAILCYPVIAWDQPYTHRGSQQNLLGDSADPDLLKSLSSELQVTDQTPPTFMFHTSADTAVPAQNSIEYYLACVRAGVPAELHLFPDGRHGLGLAKETKGADQWPGLCTAWLQRLGMVKQ